MNPDSVSVLMTTAHVSGGAPASGPIRHLLSSGIQQFHKVAQVPFINRDNARPHTARLSQQCLEGYDVLPWPARSPDLSNHVWTRWEGNCSRPEIQEINCADAKTMADLPQWVISDLIESMPRRISACTLPEVAFYYSDF
ncbi:hypothetical protein TNCV_3257621 [Trichonephila clavipes]|nr:hypothetical protein TNCV_3257621 [Trichonephila clavipes]